MKQKLLCQEKDNMKNDKKKLLKYNEKLSKRILELEEKLKYLKSEEDEMSSDESLVLDLENQVNSLNERNKGLNMTCALLTRKSLE